MAHTGLSRNSLAASAVAIVALLASAHAAAAATTYMVGPGQPYATPSLVPWESLQPGDQVLIHWRSTPYKDKWVICRQGTEALPIVVRGVPGPAGELPIIEGSGATTRLALDYWGEQRAVIKIGGASIPATRCRRYITIENLDVRAARPPYTFVDDGGGDPELRQQRRRDLDREGRAHRHPQQSRCTTPATACSSARPSRTSRATS